MMRERTTHFPRDLLLVVLVSLAIALAIKWVVALLGLHLSLLGTLRVAGVVGLPLAYVGLVRPALAMLGDLFNGVTVSARQSFRTAGYSSIRGAERPRLERSRLGASFRSAGFNRLRGESIESRDYA
jgi:hypothetical protein